MFRALAICAVSAAALTFSGSASAQSGTAAEAKAMLEKAVVAVKADKAKAIEMFLKGEGGFKDRDLYPFCFKIADGITVAAPPAVSERISERSRTRLARVLAKKSTMPRK